MKKESLSFDKYKMMGINLILTWTSYVDFLAINRLLGCCRMVKKYNEYQVEIFNFSVLIHPQMFQLLKGKNRLKYCNII